MARTYAGDPTPARHNKGGLGSMHMFDTSRAKYNYKGTGPQDVIETCWHEASNASGLCLLWELSGAPSETQMEIIEAVTGWSFKAEDQLNFGLRSVTIKQAFNVREGLKPADFAMPSRAVGEPPLQEGPLAGIIVDYKLLRQNFFEKIGWDMESGKPTLELLMKLGLHDVAKDLYE
jgi:aldehyde:ferredoxin oxidoreductase